MTKRVTFFLAALVWAIALLYPSVVEWAAPMATVSGRVLDAATHQPIGGVEVRIQASLTESATTAADGTFSIRTARQAGESVYVAAGKSDPTGTRPAYVNQRLAVLVGDGGLEIMLTPLALADDPTYTFASPQDCRLCHNVLYEYWQDSPHRNAAKNTWVRDMYDGQGTAQTGARGFTYKGAHPTLNGDCAECHSPMESAKNPGDNTDFAAVTGEAREFGVSCDVCHKTFGITNIKLPGVQGMQFARGSREILFGPLPDAAPNFPGVMRASYSPLHTTSLLCAACHEDNNDHDFDLDYLDEGSVASEETYSEWLESPYAQPGEGQKTCQDCHMPPKGDTAMCEQYQPVTRDPSQVYSHDFEGTTNEYVQNAATVRAIGRREGDRLHVWVGVTNDRTGHDLPGGQNLRHALLLVEATGPHGETLDLVRDASEVLPDYAGVGDPLQGYWSGLAGKGFAKLFGGVAGDNVFFTEALRVVSDNRIPSGVTDWSEYAFTLPEGFDPVQVNARLVYRRAFRALEDEKGWATTGHGRPNPDLIGPDFGVVMGRAAEQVPKAGPAVLEGKVKLATALKFKVDPSSVAVFAAGATVEVTDTVGAWHAFSSPSKVSGTGKKLTQGGKIDGLNIGQFWQNGESRFVRITQPDGAVSILYLRRAGTRFVSAL